MRYFFANTLLAFACLALITTPSLAQEENSTVDPYCQFTISFPEAPEIRRICEGDDMSMCYDRISYIKVFDMSSTVRVEIVCNPSTEKLYNHLTKEEMQKTVREMSKDVVLESFRITSREEEEYRQAALVGKGQAGMEESLLLAQLWSGKTSLMSVEAELSGPQLPEADELFAGILKSINYIGDLEESPQTGEEPAPAESSEDEEAVETNE